MASKIYTRTGDGGTTALADGTRVAKYALRIESYGTVDETNSWIGMARACAEKDDRLERVLEFLQQRLYNCSSNLAHSAPGATPIPKISKEDIAFLEQAIDTFEKTSGEIRGFVMPGGSELAARLHVARTVCRRAERHITALKRAEGVDDDVLKFINRASDLLFAAARYALALDGGGDVLWDRDLPPPRLP